MPGHGDRGRRGRVTTFRQLLDQFEESAKTRSAEGRRFERFCGGSESANVHANLDRHSKPTVVWHVADFDASRVDWDVFQIERPAELPLRDPKAPQPDQEKAISAVAEDLTSMTAGSWCWRAGRAGPSRRCAGPSMMTAWPSNVASSKARCSAFLCPVDGPAVVCQLTTMPRPRTASRGAGSPP